MGFIRGFCATPIAPYLIGNSQLQADTLSRLTRSRDAVRTMVMEGLDSPAAVAWFNTMRSAHRGIQLSDEHYLYVLANFYLEPLRVLKQTQRRTLNRDEHQYYLAFWIAFAQKMELSGVPSTYHEWLTLRNRYERTHAGASEASKELMQRCLYLVVNISIPWGMRQLSRHWKTLLLPQKHRQWYNLKKSCYCALLLRCASRFL